MTSYPPELAARKNSWRHFFESLGTRQRLPLLATLVVATILYSAASMHYANFFALRVFFNFFYNNAPMGIAAIGMTFVIIQGGIDLSVGSLIACGSMFIGMLVESKENGGWGTMMPPFAAMALVVVVATLMGGFMGVLIHFFDLPPFLVTLGGLFFYRGLGLWINAGRVSITHPTFKTLRDIPFRLPEIRVGGLHIERLNYSTGLPLYMFFGALVVAIYFSLKTSFGRNIYAIGGNEMSASLMGLPVGLSKVMTYAISGFCSALAAVAYTIHSGSGDSSAHIGTELNAIAAVVVGGTLLTGGVGQVAGTLLGVAIFGIIQAIIGFKGDLPPAMSKIAVGALLLGFVLLQKLIMPRRGA